MILAPVNPLFHSLLGMPSAVIYSSMACRVFRHLRIGTISDHDTSTSMGGNISLNYTRPSHPLSVVPISQHSPGALPLKSSNEPDGEIKLEVKKTMEWESHDSADSTSKQTTIGKDVV
jgi:hypothetical protein